MQSESDRVYHLVQKWLNLERFCRQINNLFAFRVGGPNLHGCIKELFSPIESSKGVSGRNSFRQKINVTGKICYNIQCIVQKFDNLSLIPALLVTTQITYGGLSTPPQILNHQDIFQSHFHLNDQRWSVSMEIWKTFNLKFDNFELHWV